MDDDREIIVKGEIENHPHLRNMPAAIRSRFNVVDYNEVHDVPPPDPSTLGVYRINDRGRGDFEASLTGYSNVDTKQVWAAVRQRTDLKPHEKTSEALRMLRDRAAARPAQPQPPAQNGFASVSVPASVPAAAYANGHQNGHEAAKSTYGPPQPQPVLVAPPATRVEIWLEGMSAPLPYFYHRVWKDGGWLRLLIDNRYPGVARFPVDVQDRPFAVAVAGHPVAYICHSASDLLEIDSYSISSLLIEGEQPVEL